jgi:hypothetical protein
VPKCAKQARAVLRVSVFLAYRLERASESNGVRASTRSLERERDASATIIFKRNIELKKEEGLIDRAISF